MQIFPDSLFLIFQLKMQVTALIYKYINTIRIADIDYAHNYKKNAVFTRFSQHQTYNYRHKMQKTILIQAKGSASFFISRP